MHGWVLLQRSFRDLQKEHETGRWREPGVGIGAWEGPAPWVRTFGISRAEVLRYRYDKFGVVEFPGSFHGERIECLSELSEIHYELESETN